MVRFRCILGRFCMCVLAIQVNGCGTRTYSSSSDAETDAVKDATEEELSWEAQIAQVRGGKRKRIELTRRAISDADLKQLRNLDGLRVLILDAGRVTDVGIATLGELTKLEELRLRSSRIGDTGLGHLCRLERLRVLNLPQADFTDEGLTQLKSLQRLELLRFGSPRVSDRGMASVRQLDKLRFLHLIDIPITDDGLLELKAMRQLESLYIDGARITDEGIEQLLAALPEVHFHIDQQHHDRDPRKADHRH